MKFYTNKIATGKASSFSEFIEKMAAANAAKATNVENKQASALSKAVVTKVAEKKSEEECLTGKQENLPQDLKDKIVEKKIEDGECEPEAKKDKSDGAAEHLKKEECYASGGKMVRIANLDAKTKSEWKAYWKKLYPSEYVEAMFADA